MLLAYGDRAELEDEEYISLSSTLESLVRAVLARRTCLVCISPCHRVALFNAASQKLIHNTVPEFISQRRRWLNGAFFALDQR